MRAVLINFFGAKVAGILLAGAMVCSQVAMCQVPANQPLPSSDTASQSLGDVARENQKKKAPAHSSSQVITNSELSGSEEIHNPLKSRTNKSATSTANTTPNTKTNQQPAIDPRVAERWKKQIAVQKNVIAHTEAQIVELRAHISSIDPAFATHSAQTEYYSNMTYDLRLGAQLAQLHAMEEQLAQQRQKLDEMQEFARHAGMHTTTYDP